MVEYLSVRFSSYNHGGERGAQVHVNGALAHIQQTREAKGFTDDHVPTGYLEWSAITVIENQTILDDKTLIELFYEANTDVAVLANHFAKDDWGLFKVRNNETYLIFQR